MSAPYIEGCPGLGSTSFILEKLKFEEALSKFLYTLHSYVNFSRSWNFSKKTVKLQNFSKGETVKNVYDRNTTALNA